MLDKSHDFEIWTWAGTRLDDRALVDAGSKLPKSRTLEPDAPPHDLDAWRGLPLPSHSVRGTTPSAARSSAPCRITS